MVAAKKELTYEWGCDNLGKTISPDVIAQIRGLVAYWDIAETGAPRVCLPDGGELSPEDSEPTDDSLVSSVQYFLANVKPEAKTYRFANPYFGNPKLEWLLDGTPPDPAVRTMLASEKTIEYKPTRDELALWRMASFNGAGIDPKRPFETFEDNAKVRNITNKTFSRLLLLMQAMLAEGTLAEQKKASVELKTQDQWEYSIHYIFKGFLEAVGDCFVDSKPMPHTWLWHDETYEIEALLIKSAEYFPNNYWYRLFYIRYVSLHQRTSDAHERLKRLRDDAAATCAQEILGNEHGTFHEILLWEQELLDNDLSPQSIKTINGILKTLSKKAFSERKSFSDSPEMHDPWEYLDFNDEYVFHYLRTLLYQSPAKCAVPGRWKPE